VGWSASLLGHPRDPQAILDNETLRATFDFTQPIALILAAILHFFPDEANPAGILATLKAALPPGSYLVATHGTSEYNGESMKEGIMRAYVSTDIRGVDRPADDFADLLFRDMALVPPGVVVLSQWRREGGSIVPSASEVGANGAVAKKL
jgi:hypothetical protein